jgi:hypothetical protein
MQARIKGPPKKATGVRLDPIVVAALETAARGTHRTVSNLIELILIQWLQKEGLLPDGYHGRP